MLAELPESIDPWRLARLHQIIGGEMPLADMPRLRESVAGADGAAQVHWAFGIDSERRAFIRGRVDAAVQMTCQRCLRPVAVTLHAETRLGLLTPTQRDDNLPEDWEPLVLEQVPVLLRDLVEDELLLALPLAAYHEVCPRNEYEAGDSGEAADDSPAEKINPFAILAGLKKTD